MRPINLCLMLCGLIALSGCRAGGDMSDHHAAPAAPPVLTGTPSWFSIGPEVYQEGDVAAAAKEVLSLRVEPRWFAGFDRVVDKAEYDRYEAMKNRDGYFSTTQEREDHRLTIPSPIPFPRGIEAIPLDDQGVKLSLALSPSDDLAVLCLRLRLAAGAVPLKREVENRWSNVLPFLFAFYIDGHAVSIPSSGWQKGGGMHSMIPLVEAGQTGEWLVKVEKSSLQKIMPDESPHMLAVVATFSNSQPCGYFEGEQELLTSNLALGSEVARQIVVRSEALTMKWDGFRDEPSSHRAELSR